MRIALVHTQMTNKYLIQNPWGCGKSSLSHYELMNVVIVRAQGYIIILPSPVWRVIFKYEIIKSIRRVQKMQYRDAAWRMAKEYVNQYLIFRYRRVCVNVIFLWFAGGRGWHERVFTIGIQLLFISNKYIICKTRDRQNIIILLMGFVIINFILV